MSDSSRQSHILLSNMGANSPQLTSYQLKEQTCDYQFSAIALWSLLPENQRPTEIRFLLTPEAESIAKKDILKEANKAGVEVKFIKLLGNETPDDSREFLERVAKEIPPGCRLTLDVTQGLRHHAFLFYALALYLGEFRDVDIMGAWYCRWEISRDPKVPRPFIDLKPVLELARWFHALAVFRETGSLREISHLMPEGTTRDLVERLSQFFLTGMPLEAGDAASQFVETAKAQPILPDLPLASEIKDAILNEVSQLAGHTFESQSGNGNKSKKIVELTQKELDRQAVFIDRYFRTGQVNLAFGLLREWTVNLIAFQRSETDHWLDRRTREGIEHALGGLGEVLKAKNSKQKKKYKQAAVRDSLSESQRAWGKRWNTLCDIRNALQHHGMKPAVFEPDRKDIPKAEASWRERAEWEVSPAFGGGQGRLLVCPIGLTPGVLYSALIHTEPARVLVIARSNRSPSLQKR